MIRHARFSLRAGDRHVLRFTLTDTDGGGAPLNLGTDTLRFSLAVADPATGALSAVAEKVSGDGIAAHDVDGAVYDVTLAGADTAGLRGVRQFELELVDSAGETTALAVGEIDFAPGISSA